MRAMHHVQHCIRAVNYSFNSTLDAIPCKSIEVRGRLMNGEVIFTFNRGKEQLI